MHGDHEAMTHDERSIAACSTQHAVIDISYSSFILKLPLPLPLPRRLLLPLLLLRLEAGQFQAPR